MNTMMQVLISTGIALLPRLPVLGRRGQGADTQSVHVSTLWGESEEADQGLWVQMPTGCTSVRQLHVQGPLGLFAGCWCGCCATP